MDNYIEQCLACKELNDIRGGWIPTQEELQTLIKSHPKYENMNDLKLDVHMRSCLFKNCCQSVLMRISFNEMWLMFYMIEIHNKKWYSSKKEWI